MSATVDFEVVSDEIISGSAMLSKQETMKETDMLYATTKDRIAQVIYVVGAIASIVVTVIITHIVIRIILQGIRWSSDPEFMDHAFIYYALSIIPYCFGWALRWIINGTSTSVINYFRPKQA